jgi:glycylpeptide N-tetradecanoyltransferase
LLTRYLTKFAMKVLFTVEEVRHWLLPRDQVIQSYVIVNENNNEEVTDLISFYYLPSTVLHHNDKLRAAYSYYNVATSVPLAELMNDALILAKAHGNDVFNALDLMDNAEIMEQLKFGRGDGNLQYYIYNWACADMKSNDIGIVLL